MAEVVVGEWTPIGTAGFEYFWEPADSVILWRHPVAELKARCEVTPEDLGDSIYFAYLVQRRTWDLEKSYRTLLEEEGLPESGSGVWH